MTTTAIAISDAFTRANNASSLGTPDVGPAWGAANAGTAGINTNKAYFSATVAAYSGVAIETGRSDCVVEVTVSTFDASGFAGLWLRAGSSILSGLMVQYDSVWTGASGGNTQLGSNFSANFASGDRMRAVLQGTSITIYRQVGAVGAWTQVYSVTSSIDVTNTRHGLNVFGSAPTTRFDDFLVTTASFYMPEVGVEIAFGSSYSTPAASRVWTDVSQYVELHREITITHGRSDESSDPEPNRLTLTLDNSDGRFTAGKTGSPYYPNVKIGVPIRVTATPVGGTTSTRFVGFIEEWPVEWDGSDSYASAKITAYSRMARLGGGATLRGNVQEQFLRASGIQGYWPLDDPKDSETGRDAYGSLTLHSDSGSSQFQGESLNLAGEPSATGASIGINFGLQPDAGAFSVSQAGGDIVVEAFVQGVEPIGRFGIFYLAIANESDYILATYTPIIGHLFGQALAFYSTGTSVGVGVAQHIAVAMTRSGGNNTVSLYVDGVFITSDTQAKSSRTYTIARFARNLAPLTPGEAQAGLVSHVMVSRDVAGIADRARAGLTGFAGESAGDRIERIAGWAGVAATELSLDDGKTVGALDTAGVSAVEAMRSIAATDGGVLFDAADGTLKFKAASSRYRAAVALTLSAASQQIESGFAPKLDRSALINDAIVASPAGTGTASDASSISDYGIARSSPQLPAGSLDDASSLAKWIVEIYSDPTARVPTLPFDLLPLSAANQAAALALEMGSRISITGLPSQASASSLDFFVEGYTETIGKESYMFTHNVSPVPALYDQVWVLGDATYGVLDSTTKLGY